MAPLNTYQTSVVAYLDVMGMEEAVSRSVKEPELATAIEGMLSKIQTRCAESTKQWDEGYPVRARAFSDNVVLTCPNASDYALRKIAVYVSAYQMEVALHGFFMRGAVTVGPHCGRNDVCFGPALIEAYEAERQLANWPRVIVLPNALNLRAEGSHPYLLRDDAGVTYVDYLHLCVTNVMLESRTPESKQAGLHPYSWIGLVEKHKTALETAVKVLNADSPQFIVKLSKYHSLAQYHNRYLRQYLRGGKDFPLTEIAKLILSSRKGMTNDRMNKKISEITRFVSEKHEQIRGCLIDVRKVFVPLRHRRARSP